jgi:K+-transporting ATPase KdpF subunit
MTVWQRRVHDAGFALYHFNGGSLVLLLALGEIPGKGFAMMQAITAIVALALIVYLFVSIFKPEKF